MTRPFAVLTIAVATSVAIVAQQSPARDAAARPSPGTSMISGTVVSDDAERRPIRMATMTLNGSPLPTAHLVTTDENGAFAFRDLPAGRYLLSASKPGYLSMEYGAKRTNGTGVPVVVGAGEQATVPMRLPKGGVIAGTIRGADGEPAPTASVRLMRYSTNTNGDRVLNISGSGWRTTVVTDDLGSYRFYGLAPGDYYVAALPQFSGSNARQLTSADFDWAGRALSASAQVSQPPPAGQPSSYSPVLYPGVTDSAAATSVTISGAEEHVGIDFSLQYVPTATITGTILDPDGLPPQVAQANMLNPAQPVFLVSPVFIRPGPDGKFSTSGVLPGQYVLAARGSAHGTGGVAGPLLYWASLDVAVDGRDITNLDVKLQPSMSVTGRVVFDGADAKPPDDPSKVRVSLSLVQSGTTVSLGALDGKMNADGTFAIPGVSPGRYRLDAFLPAAPGTTSAWTLRSSMVNGLDSLDYPFDMRPGASVTDTVVRFTDRPTEINGTLVDQAGRPAPQYFIVVFSADRTFWMPRSRRVRSLRPGNTGSFKITGLPPGEYFVCALTDLEPAQLYTSAFLEPLMASSYKIALAEGEKKTQDLKLARTPAPAAAASPRTTARAPR